MNRLLVIYSALLLCLAALTSRSQQAIDWKKYHTINSNEGISWSIDPVPLPLPGNVGLPALNISPDGRIILSYALTTGGRGAAVITGSGAVYTIINDTTLRPAENDGCFLYLPDGRTRFLAEARSPTWTRQKQRLHIVSYISDDGINWIKENGIRYQPGIQDDSISNLPAVIQINDTVWRMYYCADFYGSSPNTTRTAISRDWGMTWISESNGSIFRSGDVDPHPMYLTDGKIRVYFRYGFGKPPEQAGIGFCDSDDGLNFDTTTIRHCFRDAEAPAGRKLDPAIINMPDSTLLCFFGGEVNGSIVMMKAISTPATSIAEPPAFHEAVLLPNPAHGQATLNFITAAATGCSITVYNILGNQVFYYGFFSKTGANSILLPSFAPGIFAIRLTAGTSTENMLFVTE